MKVFKQVLKAGLLTALVLSLAACSKTGGKDVQYDLTTIAKGRVEKTISATGSLEPPSTVTVRAPVSSTVEQVYVDYNSVVKKGDLLAKLKTDTLQNSYEKLKNTYETALTDYNNEKALHDKQLASDKDLSDAYNTMYGARIDMDNALTNLNDAIITSPIDGIVLTRDVSEGDTVTGNSNTSGTEMFTLAKNLNEMQIEAGVGEADVSSIYIGMPVTFTLEALPGKTYQGSVKNRYLMPTTTNNVNSYTCIISVDNSENTLFPGMTCNVEFIVANNTNVLTVTNAALRYEPSWYTDAEVAAAQKKADEAVMTPEQLAAAEAAEKEKAAAGAAAKAAGSRPEGVGMIPGVGGMARAMGGMRRPGGTASGGESEKESRAANAWTKKYLWYLDADKKLSCMEVLAGTTDGSKTMVKAPTNSKVNLEGMQVITREKVNG